MFQKSLNVYLSFCLRKLLVAVKSILWLNLINNGVLLTKIYIHSQEYIFVEFNNSSETLMRSSVTWMCLFLVVFTFI